MRSLKKAKTQTRAISYKTIGQPIFEYVSPSKPLYKEIPIRSLKVINRKTFRLVYFNSFKV